MNNKKYKSDAFAAIHESMEALSRIGVVDKKTMRHFDETCIEPVEMMQPHQIKALRKRENVSQPIFALYLSVSRNTVSDWERGVKRPSGPASRLLYIAQEHGIDALVSLPMIESEYHNEEEDNVEVLEILRSIQAELKEISDQVRSNSDNLHALKRSRKSYDDGDEIVQEFFKDSLYTDINEINDLDVSV